ncbi:N-carbamoylputrescine amidase [Capsicum chinense]|nr:N-carbamoylputrescine amidase [Capsicum chinense]
MAEKNRLVTVAALQFACTDDVSTNVATAERLVRAAHQKGANIILIQLGYPWSTAETSCRAVCVPSNCLIGFLM